VEIVVRTIVYFHGFGSSPTSDKVDRIKAYFPNDMVLAFSANVDPVVAKKEVGDAIYSALVDEPNIPEELVFVGTSLGAWLANELADEFNARAVLINPSYDPSKTLGRYNVSPELTRKYHKMGLTNMSKKVFVVDRRDEVIDHTELLDAIDNCAVFYDGAGHRFNGKEFDEVLLRYV
jgi:predicted esterase YcpF (UPF0227 family)